MKHREVKKPQPMIFKKHKETTVVQGNRKTQRTPEHNYTRVNSLGSEEDPKYLTKVTFVRKLTPTYTLVVDLLHTVDSKTPPVSPYQRGFEVFDFRDNRFYNSQESSDPTSIDVTTVIGVDTVVSYNT